MKNLAKVCVALLTLMALADLCQIVLLSIGSAPDGTGWTVFGIGLELAVAVAFLWWLYRVAKALVKAGSSLTFSPAAAVWEFFVPVMNIVRPLHIVREIWREARPDRRSPVGWWWGAFLLSNVFGQMALNPDTMKVASPEMAIASAATDMAAALLCIVIVTGIEGSK